MARAIASTALSLMIVVLLVLAGFVRWSAKEWQAEGPLSQAMCLEVRGGDARMSMGDVATVLAERGAISSRAIFSAGVDYLDRAQDLKAGSFLIESGASMADITAQITGAGASTCGNEIVWRIGVTRISGELRALNPETGRYEQGAKWSLSDGETAPESAVPYFENAQTKFRVVLAEGVTSWQAREGLNAIGILDGMIAEIPSEGSLAPGSYEIKAGGSAQNVINEMTAQQSQILADEWAARADDAAVTSPEEALILASIIEKETGIATERGAVASVFTNRLRQGMRLQTDPTVIYGITKGEGILGRGLRRSELDRATPWNTYTIDGLPPTPIANPGRDSIHAALNPDSTEYVFFVADGTGGHAFATTLEQHNRNVARWREIEAQRNGN